MLSNIPASSRFAVLRREPLVLLVVAIWAAVYATRPSLLPLRGEEPRRARIAQEMIDTGDYFVSRVQGVPELGRPPLAEWAIVGSSLMFGEMSPQAIRFPAMAAMLITALALYFYVRRFRTSYGAAAAALVYLSFGQMLQMGRIAESDSLYAAMTALALFGWHRGYIDGRAPWRVWTWGYGFAALAVLAKSPQAGVYFVAAVTVYLAWRRDWRFLFAPGHVIGGIVCALVIGAWAVPYQLSVGSDTLGNNLLLNIVDRFLDTDRFLRHLWEFPWQVVGALLPWSLLLVRYLDPRFRRELGSDRDAAVFCGMAVGVTFPTVWFSCTAMPRHYLTLYPCLAVLAGVVVDRSLAAEPATSLARGWRWLAGFAATASLIVVLALGITSLVDIPAARRFEQPVTFVVVFASAAICAALVVLWSIRPGRSSPARYEPRRFAGFAAVVSLLGLLYAGLGLNLIAGLSEDHATAMQRLKRQLPAEARLVSFGFVDAVFAFHYRDPIRLLPWSTSDGGLPAVGDYFAFDPVLSEGREPDFPWQRVAVFACDRNRHDVPQRPVVIGRRIAETAAGGTPAIRR